MQTVEIHKELFEEVGAEVMGKLWCFNIRLTKSDVGWYCELRQFIGYV